LDLRVSSGSGLRFAVATFDNVFDTTPERRVVDLDALLDAFQRFELRDDVAAKVARRRAQVEEAAVGWAEGRLVGKDGTALAEAAKNAASRGLDPTVAVQERLERLRHEAKHDAKRLIALWSPACYAENAHRGTADVLHLSCLALDHDAGVTADEILAIWHNTFVIVHTTWSHTPDRPRLRTILPLARPALAADWDRVWAFAADRAGRKVDPAPSSPGSTFALPAVPSEGSPRATWIRGGELWDPIALGLCREALPPGPVAWREAHHFDGGRPKKRQLRGPLDRRDAESSSPLPAAEDLDFDAFG
jgi:hypothetical protein